MSDTFFGPMAGPVNPDHVPLTRQDLAEWSSAMTAAEVAIRDDFRARESFTRPVAFDYARFDAMADVLRKNGFSTAVPQIVKTEGKLHYAYMLDDFIEHQALSREIKVRRTREGLFCAQPGTYLTVGQSNAGSIIDRAFEWRLEAVLYALGKHPEAELVYWPGRPQDYKAWQQMKKQLESFKAQPPQAPVHAVGKINSEFANAFGEEVLAEFFQAVADLAREQGIKDPDIFKQLDKGIEFGKHIAAKLRKINDRLDGPKFPVFTTEQLAELTAKVLPKLDGRLGEIGRKILNREQGFDPFGGGLPPGASTEETGQDWEKPEED